VSALFDTRRRAVTTRRKVSGEKLVRHVRAHIRCIRFPELPFI